MDVATDLKLKKCFVLNDNQTYGQGVAKAFKDEAVKQGITILGEEKWEAGSANYKSLFGKIQSLEAELQKVTADLQSGPAGARRRELQRERARLESMLAELKS